MRFSDAAPASQGIPLALRASVGGQDSSGRPLGARGVPNTPALSKSCSPGKPRVAFGSAYKGPTTPKPTGIPSIASKSRTTPGGVGQTTPGPGVTTPGLQQLTASLGLSTSGARRYTPGPGPRRSSVQGGDQPGSARPPSRPGSSHGIIDNGPFNKGPGYKGEDAKKDAKIVDLRAPRKEHQRELKRSCPSICRSLTAFFFLFQLAISSVHRRAHLCSRGARPPGLRQFSVSLRPGGVLRPSVSRRLRFLRNRLQEAESAHLQACSPMTGPSRLQGPLWSIPPPICLVRLRNSTRVSGCPILSLSLPDC